MVGKAPNRTWPWWLGAGALAGGIVISVTATTVSLIEAWRGGESSWQLVDVLLFAGLFALYGAVAGAVVGLICALALPAMERSASRSSRHYGRFAASVTALFVVPIAIFLGLLATMEVDNLLALAVEISVPTFVSIGVAHLVGQRIWQRRWGPSAAG